MVIELVLLIGMEKMSMEEISAGMYIAKLDVYSDDGDFTSKSIRIILMP